MHNPVSGDSIRLGSRYSVALVVVVHVTNKAADTMEAALDARDSRAANGKANASG